MNITKKDLSLITIAKAVLIAAQHENDPEWDFWNLVKEDENEPKRQDDNQMDR